MHNEIWLLFLEILNLRLYVPSDAVISNIVS